MAASENLGISEETRNFLNNHLEDLKFVDDYFKLKGYSCCVCRKLAISHCIANCRDVFCNTCYGEHYKRPCPCCKEIVETNSQNQGFERAVFDFKVECKFRKNGCEEILELKNFLNHIHICKFATEKLLPKLYREGPIAGALHKLIEDNVRIKEVIESVQTEYRRVCNELQEMNISLRNAMDLHTSTFKKLTDEIQNKDTTGPVQAEIKYLKIDLKKHELAGEALQAEHNSQIQKIQALTDDDLRSTIPTELMQTLIIALKKSEESTKIMQQEKHCQLKNIKENHTALTVIDDEHKKAAELMQNEIMLLKDALKNSEEATKELQEKHKEEIQDIKSHQIKHLEVMEIKRCAQFRDELTECQFLHEGGFIGSSPAAIMWKIAGIQKKLKLLKSGIYTCIRSKGYFNVSDAFQFRPILFRDSETNSIHINLEFVDKLTDYKHNFALPYLHSRKYILLDQSTSTEKCNIELIDRPSFGMNTIEKMMLPRFNYSRFFPNCLLKGENRYLKNDQILIKITLKPISFLYKNIASNNGILLWHIDNYSKKKRDEIDRIQECLISRPFKTSETGYLLQVELFLNGYESAQGQFLSIYSRVIMEENDADLPCPLTYKCSFYLMDVSDSDSKINITKCWNSMEVDQTKSNWGFPKFVLQSQAEEQKYLKDDSLFIKVVAQVL